MKTLFFAVLLISSISFSQVSSGDTSVVLPQFKSLKEAMKDMSKKLKVISSQAKDPAKNADSSHLSNEFMKSVMAAKTFVPDSAKDQNAKALYEKMMDQTIALAKQMSESFQKNDNSQALEMLNKLSQAKKDGHNEFN